MIIYYALLLLGFISCRKYDLEGKTPEEVYAHFYSIFSNDDIGRSDLIDAIDLVESAYKTFPNDFRIIKLRSISLAKLANLYLLQKDNEQAEKFANLSIELDKSNTDARHTLSYIYWARGEVEKTLEQNKKILKIDQNDYHAASDIGFISCVNNRHKDSIKYSLLALKLFPESPVYEEDKKKKLQLIFCVGYSNHFVGQDQMAGIYLADFLDQAKNFKTWDSKFPQYIISAEVIMKNIKANK